MRSKDRTKRSLLGTTIAFLTAVTMSLPCAATAQPSPIDHGEGEAGAADVPTASPAGGDSNLETEPTEPARFGEAPEGAPGVSATQDPDVSPSRAATTSGHLTSDPSAEPSPQTPDPALMQCLADHEQGQVLRLGGELLAARARMIGCSSEACPAKIRSDCTTWRGELEGDIPSIVIDIRSLNYSAKDVSLTLDGRRFEQGLDGRAHPVDPGPHEVSGTLPNGISINRPFFIAQGQRNLVISLEFGALEQARRPTSRPVPPLVIVLAGVGITGVAVGTGFGIDALLKKSDGASCSPLCPDDQADALRQSAIASDVALGVGILSSLAAALLYATRPTVYGESRAEAEGRIAGTTSRRPATRAEVATAPGERGVRKVVQPRPPAPRLTPGVGPLGGWLQASF